MNKTFKIFHKRNLLSLTHSRCIFSIYQYCYIDNDTLYISKNTNSYKMANYEWISNLKVSYNFFPLCFRLSFLKFLNTKSKIKKPFKDENTCCNQKLQKKIQQKVGISILNTIQNFKND